MIRGTGILRRKDGRKYFLKIYSRKKIKIVKRKLFLNSNHNGQPVTPQKVIFLLIRKKINKNILTSN